MELIYKISQNSKRNANKMIERLKTERLKQNLTQMQLSDLSGVSISMINSVERKVRKPTLLVFIKLCEALGLEIVFIQRDV
jgi:transcriptional regulator with XRE-family HTH domain